MIITTARRSYASAVMGVEILSVCLSVRRSHACFVTNPKNLPSIILYGGFKTGQGPLSKLRGQDQNHLKVTFGLIH